MCNNIVQDVQTADKLLYLIGTIDQSVRNQCKGIVPYWIPCSDFSLIGQLFQLNIAVCPLFVIIVLWFCL